MNCSGHARRGAPLFRGSKYLYVVDQRTRPNVTVTGLGHLLAGTYVTFAGRHRRPGLQRVPDGVAAVQQHHVAEHHATSSTIVGARWAQERVVRLEMTKVRVSGFISGE